MGIYFWLIIFSLLFSAFFSGIEIAFYQANPLRAEVSKSRGVFSGRLVSFFLQHPSAYITNCLTGNNIAVVIYGISFNALFAYLFSLTAVDIFQNAVFVFFFNTIISSILILLLAEFYPKVFFIINPNKSLNILALPFAITYLILFPLNIIVNFISRGLLLATGTRVTKAKPTFDYYDLFNVVLEGDLDTTPDTGLDLDTQIFKNAIELPNIKAREFLIPRPEVQAIEITESIHALKEKFITTGHSKIVVYDGSIDQVVGYVHMIDLYAKPTSISSIVKPMIIVAESMPANKVLKEFTKSNRSLGLVVDEFGGTAGIITIEDVLEEIFGEIEDEYDSDELREVMVNDTEYIFSARLEIDYLNDKYNLKLPTGDYETLGGLILELNQSIPSKNTVIDMEGFRFRILSASDHRIDEIQVKIRQLSF